MKKYDYKVIEFNTNGFWGGKVDVQEIEKRLKELGTNGWKVSTSFTSNESYGRTKSIVYTLIKEFEE